MSDSLSLLETAFEEIGKQLQRIANAYERKNEKSWPLKIDLHGAGIITLNSNMTFSVDYDIYSQQWFVWNFGIVDNRSIDSTIKIIDAADDETIYASINTFGSENLNDWTITPIDFSDNVSFID